MSGRARSPWQQHGSQPPATLCPLRWVGDVFRGVQPTAAAQNLTGTLVWIVAGFGRWGAGRFGGVTKASRPEVIPSFQGARELYELGHGQPIGMGFGLPLTFSVVRQYINDAYCFGKFSKQVCGISTLSENAVAVSNRGAEDATKCVAQGTSNLSCKYDVLK